MSRGDRAAAPALDTDQNSATISHATPYASQLMTSSREHDGRPLRPVQNTTVLRARRRFADEMRPLSAASPPPSPLAAPRLAPGDKGQADGIDDRILSASAAFQ